MIKDLLIVADAVGEAAGPYALSLAREVGAAAGCLYLQPEGGDEAPLAELPYGFALSAREAALAVVRDAADDPSYAARTADVPMEMETLSGSAGDIRSRLLDRARLADLIVVERADPGRDKPADAYIEDLLLGAGRPILVVPARWGRPARFGAVTVAWDGSAAAARALADALPLLSRAERVRVLTVQTEAVAGVSEGGARVVKHLGRHGIAADYRAIISGTTVGETLLAEVAQAGVDLLVMGAYGHSRLREVFLGGASRDLLRRITVPTLMAH
ncbi:universal stress protein [Methylobacterium fujisawaense]|uniref:universal stress protein n=1 Tax=Methylobacterium fujisawaense TaxID=107400 RepID=UPI0031F4C4BC